MKRLNITNTYQHPPPLDQDTEQAKLDIEKLLSKWGVEDFTSNKVGAEITTKECIATCTYLPKKKASGPDRILNEWYRTFAKKIGKLIAASFNQARKANKLPKGFNDGLVSLIYKKGSRSDIRNYRPITLLNGDYKILTRIIAHRMLEIVSQCVSPEQIGFKPRTFIAETSMLINLIKAHLESIDEGGLMTFLDLEKAFDKVSWDYMKRSFRALRFTNSAMSWINILYDDTNRPKRKILANGELSRPYRIARGTAQGCPLSPLCFLIVVEGLTRLIKNNKNIHGITIGGHEFKIRHFADDSFGILADDDPYDEFNSEVKRFFKASAMSENFTKRENIALGSFASRDPSTLPGTASSWKKKGEYLITLGIPFGNDFDEEAYLKSKIMKAKKTLINARYVSSMSISGRSKLVNAN